MVWTEITSVEPIDSAGAHLQAWGMDLPRVCRVDGHFLDIAGWAVARDKRIETITVTRNDGCFLSSGRIQLVRPDVIDHLGLEPDRVTGFHFAISAVSLPPQFALRIVATLEGDLDDGTLIAVIRGARSRLHTSFRPVREPLSLTSLGRTGTTLLMQMLAAHPEVVTRQVYPYETRIAGWWMHVLTILASPSNIGLSSHPDTFLDEEHSAVVGFNPWALDGQMNGPAFASWVRGGAVDEIAAFCQRQIDESYRRIARDQNEEDSRFFLEKAVPTHVPRLFWNLYDGTREIVLVRDFRDMLCSMMAFDAKRNRNDFRHSEEDQEAFLVRIVRDLRRLVLSWEERRESALLVRYEDAVRTPEANLRRIAEYAGLDSSPEAIAAMLAAADSSPQSTQEHRTTATSAQSVHRYRSEMSPELRARSLELGGDLLAELGYDAD